MSIHPVQVSRAQMHFYFPLLMTKLSTSLFASHPPGSAPAYTGEEGCVWLQTRAHSSNLATWSWPRKSSRACWAINVNLQVTKVWSGAAPRAGPAGQHPLANRRWLSSQPASGKTGAECSKQKQRGDTHWIFGLSYIEPPKHDTKQRVFILHNEMR